MVAMKTMPPVHYTMKIGGCPLCGGRHLEGRYPKRYTIYQCLKCGYRTKKFRDSARRVRVPPELRPFVKRVKYGRAKKAWATWWPGKFTNPLRKPRKDWGIPWTLIAPVVFHGKLKWRRTDYVPRAAGRPGWSEHSMDHPNFSDALNVGRQQNVLLSAIVSRPGSTTLLGAQRERKHQTETPIETCPVRGR